MTLTLEQQLENLKTRALAARGTPAETTFNLLIASLEEKIQQSSQPPQECYNPTAYFQGIGTIYGKITPSPDNPERYTVKSGQSQWTLDVPKFLRDNVNSVIAKSVNLRVYPKAVFDKQYENNYHLGFQLMTLKPPPKSENAGLFTLKGIWQTIPESPYPVITIYRNQRRLRKDLCEPNHIPVDWKKPPVPPFQHDQDTTELSPRYFCQVTAKLRPKLKTYSVLDILEPPTELIPKYIQPGKPQRSRKSKPTYSLPTDSSGQYIMPTTARMDVTLKINEFPNNVKNVKNGWKQFQLNCDGRIVIVTVKPRMFRKLEEARDNYPMWVAAISGKMGASTERGFILDQPSIQTFEKKPKPPKEG